MSMNITPRHRYLYTAILGKIYHAASLDLQLTHRGAFLAAPVKCPYPYVIFFFFLRSGSARAHTPNRQATRASPYLLALPPRARPGKISLQPRMGTNRS